jgi:hypothetical protein
MDRLRCHAFPHEAWEYIQKLQAENEKLKTAYDKRSRLAEERIVTSKHLQKQIDGARPWMADILKYDFAMMEPDHLKEISDWLDSNPGPGERGEV